MADTKKKSTAGKKDTPKEGKAPKKKDAQGKKKAGGRKSVYTEKVLPKLELVEGWARDGLSEKDIAHNLGIALSTLSEYKNKFSEFSEAIKKGKEVSDYIAENRLFLKVCGFSKVIKKPFKIKVPVMQNGIKVADKEEIVTADEEVYFPPDLGAIVFYLKNRLPEKWSDAPKKDIAETDGGGVIILPEREDKIDIDGIGTLKVKIEK